MIIRLLPHFLLVIVCACSNPGTEKPDKNNTEDIHQTLKQIRSENEMPGLALVLVRGDSTTLLKSVGVKDENTNSQVNDSTLFSAQSISKTFTSLACLTLVQDQLLDLDVPIVKYMPDFRVNSIHEEKAYAKITLRHLLSHTSGLPVDAPLGNNFVPDFEDNVYVPLADRTSSIRDVWLRARVGQRYSYSNIGFDLVARIIELVSQMTYAEYVQQHVLAPLGMKHSSFDMESFPTLPNVAKGHCDGFNGTVPVKFSAFGAGGLYTCATDMAFFLRAALSQFNQILNDSLYKELISIPNSHESNGYALGLTINDFQYCTPTYGHTGNGYGFTSSMFWMPEDSIGVAILSNRESTYSGHLDLHHAVLNSNIISAKHDLACQNIAQYPIRIHEEDRAYYERVSGSYSDGTTTLAFEVRDSTFGVLSPGDGTFQTIHFISKDQWAIEDSGIIRFTLHNDHLTNQNNGMTFLKVLDDPTIGGEDKPSWKLYAGTYRAYAYGILESTETIDLQNGYLRLNGTRLNEYRPGLFFDQFGQVVDFRSGKCQIEYGTYIKVE